MSIDDAKAYLGATYILHECYCFERNPWHSPRNRVDVRMTFARVIARRIRIRAERAQLRRVA